FDVQFGLVEGLLNAKIYRAGDEFQAVQQVVCKHPIGLKIASEDLDVNGSGQADIVNQAGQFGLRNLFADDCFDLVAERGGFFDARAGGSAHVQFEFAAVHFREKVLPEQRQQREGKHAKRQEADGEDHAVGDATLQQAMVTIAQAIEMDLKCVLHAHKRIGGGFGGRVGIFFGAGLE